MFNYSCSSQKMELSKLVLKSIPILTNSQEFIKNNEKTYYISTELVSFSLFYEFFISELKEATIPDEKKIILTEDFIITDKIKISSPNFKNDSKNRMFVSEMIDDYFFIEYFYTEKKFNKYINRIEFGNSFVYLFKRVNKDAKLIGVKEFHYN